MRFLVDADLPRSLASALRARGYDADDVRDLGLGGSVDEVILTYAVRNDYVLISGDKGFTNVLRFPLGSYPGIIVGRFRRHALAPEKTRLLLRWIPTLDKNDIRGNLVIIQVKGIRIRRFKP